MADIADDGIKKVAISGNMIKFYKNKNFDSANFIVDFSDRNSFLDATNRTLGGIKIDIGIYISIGII